ncbi:MAG: 1-(5-phosphoribosyl)-5-((5-phosphoribosylamino)methylideneamino)imidazole-4-carboxamide isomerase, partial [Actinobacteria bacterium]|nr:1-(5-phosphoribosyl)-5-((5-phosphoribosylamino)methylideneamino)imidazole-4-carboxamide isomerase [Actinomycetota bacterium]
MDLYPAIDLRAGRCVRLYQGDFDRETVYDSDPVARARAFAGAGAPWVHVVDLDASRGQGSNRSVVEAITAAVPVPVQTGGGVRDASLL